MAAHPLPVPAETDKRILTHVGRLVRLEWELALAESRELLVTAAPAIALGVAGAFALIAALVVGLAALLAPLFAARWEHLAVAGGVTLVLSVGAVAWSTWRLKTLGWPRLTLISLEETWRWLEAQLKSRLRLR